MSRTDRISALIIHELAAGERGALSLIVALRRSLDRSGKLKGNLAEIVRSSLRTLVASKAVVDDDGTYSLAHRT